MGKFYENNCLMQQAYVKNGDQTVEQYVAEMAKKAGGTMKVGNMSALKRARAFRSVRTTCRRSCQHDEVTFVWHRM